ncbi:hypothetical protein CM49_01123 [Paenibacillus sp. P1XP2]|nr:hypothetical protein CM49_01123 [Paenibacillus sp. P1XP2]
MSLTFCNVHFSQKPEKVVYVSNNLLKSLKLSGKKNIQLRLGRDVIHAAVKSINKPGKHLYLARASATASACLRPAAFIYATRITSFSSAR